MPFSTRQLPGEPIVIATAHSPLKIETDMPELAKQITEFLQKIPGKIYYISDTSLLDHLEFRDVVIGMAEVTRGPAAFLSNERLQTIVVGSTQMIQLAVQSVSQEQYGGLNIVLYSSLDEAIQYARNQIAKGK